MQTSTVQRVVELVPATGIANPEHPKKSPILFTVYQTSTDLSQNDNYNACIGMLRHSMLPYRIVIDIREAMKVSKGTISPSWGFVLESPDDQVIRDCHQLSAWIVGRGLVPL